MKPDFIQNLEKGNKYFSYVKLSETNIFFPKNLKEKNYIPVYSERYLNLNKSPEIEFYILKTAQGFFICFNKLENDSWDITIYFEEAQESELKFFINNFLKTFKNATNNNK